MRNFNFFVMINKNVISVLFHIILKNRWLICFIEVIQIIEKVGHIQEQIYDSNCLDIFACFALQEIDKKSNNKRMKIE